MQYSFDGALALVLLQLVQRDALVDLSQHIAVVLFWIQLKDVAVICGKPLWVIALSVRDRLLAVSHVQLELEQRLFCFFGKLCLNVRPLWLVVFVLC